MRRVTLILPFLIFAFFLNLQVFAQAPPKFNFQAVARDAAGNYFVGPITVRITISDGTNFYVETHFPPAVTANKYGLFSVEIGGGQTSSSNTKTLAQLSWSQNQVNVTIEVNPGTGFVTIGSKQLLSVPYALYANSAGPGTSSGANKIFKGIKGIRIDSNSVPGTLIFTNTLTIDSLNTSAFVKSGSVPGTKDIGNYLVWNGVNWSFNTDSLQYKNLAKGAAVDGQVLKLVGGRWTPSPDQVGPAGGGILDLNTLNNSIQGFKVDSSGSQFNIIPDATTGTHIFNIPTIGIGVSKGLLSIKDYNTFKNASTGNLFIVGQGLAKNGTNNIRLNINGTLDTSGGILRVTRTRLDSIDILGSKENNILKIKNGKLTFVADTAYLKGTATSSNYKIGSSLLLQPGNVLVADSNKQIWNANKLLGKPLSGKLVDGGYLQLNPTRDSIIFSPISGGSNFWTKSINGIDYLQSVGIGGQASKTNILEVTGKTALDKLYVGGAATIDSLADIRYLKFRGGDYFKRHLPGAILTALDTTGNVGWASPGNSSGWTLNGNDISALPGSYIGTNSVSSLRLKTSGIERMVIDSITGNVGIGVKKPVKSLSLSGGLLIDFNQKSNDWSAHINPNGPYLLFGGQGEGITSQRVISPSNNSNLNGLDFFTNFDTRLSISQSGLIGIGGALNPTHILHVGNTNGTNPTYNVRFEAYGGKGKRALYVDNLGVVRDTTIGGGIKYKIGKGLNLLPDTTLEADNSKAIWNAGQLQNRPLAPIIPTAGQVLKFKGGQWIPSSDSAANIIGTSYTAGRGMTLNGTVFEADSNLAIWNANKILSLMIDTTGGLKVGNVLKYKGGKIVLAKDSLGSGTNTWITAGNDIYNANTGNVGIGTALPAIRLDVTGSGFNNGSMGIKSELTTWDHLYFTHDGSIASITAGGVEKGLSLKVGKSVTGTYGDASQNYIEAIRILVDGKVGLGVSNPLSQVHNKGYFRSDSLRSNDGNPRLLIARSNGIIDTLNSKKGVLASDGVNISWVPGGSKAWSLSGNNITPTEYLGTSAGEINPLIIKTNGNPRITIDSTGKIGIGTKVSARAFLEQKGSTSGVAAIFGGEAAGVSLLSSTSGIGFNQYISPGPKSISAGFGGFIAVDNASSGEMWFGTSTNATGPDQLVKSTIKMTLSQTGSLGIGLKPLSKLHVNGYLRLDSLRGSDTSSVAVTPTGLLIRTKSSSNPGWDLSGNDIIPGQFIGTTSPTDSFIIKTNNQTRIAISPNSTNVGIGGLPLSNATLAVYGNLVSGSISNPSDIRYKKNVAKIDGALQKVSKLSGVSYNWKREDFAQMNFMEGKDFGLIAQEVEVVFPELVLTDERGFKSVRYTQLIPFLLEAIKEQQKQIEHLSNEVQVKDTNLKVVENKINVLETSINTMNSQMQLLLKSMGNPAEVVSSK